MGRSAHREPPYPGVRCANGVAPADVGGAAHNGRMNDFETCERCDGSGADPRQSFDVDLVDVCGDCRGDGVVVTYDERELAVARAA